MYISLLNKYKYLLLALIGVVYISVVSVFIRYFYSKIHYSHPEVLSATTTNRSVFTDLSKQLYGKPSQLIYINDKKLHVVPVGVDSDGFMLTPADWEDAGWYINSTKVGEVGNMIINGHYDDKYGKPAAFWQLKNIQIGDKLTVVDEFGKSFSYSVTEIYYVDINSSDRFKVFSSEENKSVLTLVTCGGAWLPKESTYNKRLIVRAELL